MDFFAKLPRKWRYSAVDRHLRSLEDGPIKPSARAAKGLLSMVKDTGIAEIVRARLGDNYIKVLEAYRWVIEENWQLVEALGSNANQALLSALYHRSGPVREQAARLLAKSADTASVPALIRYLDRDVDIGVLVYPHPFGAR